MKNVKVIEKDYLFHNGKAVDGLAAKEGTIEIVSEARKKYRLYLLIHEMNHILNWKWSEKRVREQSKKMADLLWKEKYRKCDT
jgi:hypothetical protein